MYWCVRHRGVSSRLERATSFPRGNTKVELIHWIFYPPNNHLDISLIQQARKRTRKPHAENKTTPFAPRLWRLEPHHHLPTTQTPTPLPFPHRCCRRSRVLPHSWSHWKWDYLMAYGAWLFQCIGRCGSGSWVFLFLYLLRATKHREWIFLSYVFFLVVFFFFLLISSLLTSFPFLFFFLFSQRPPEGEDVL